MKTIVARFTEMKKSPNEIIDVEGEEVSANKVEAALKSVGVQLRDTNGEFRNLDDVFLELASKWDSLDKMSQRYVATMAAGSRQQSRFIAMMSNYQRTMELTGYATNSAGASQKQFEKTMDSLESKLNRLHDVWEQFTTGIANQNAIKGVVDLLTNFLTVVNNLTDALDPLHTGWSKILTAFLSFKAAKGAVNSILRGVGTQLGTRSKTDLDEKQGAEDGVKYGKGFWGAFKKISAQKKGGVGPISEAIAANKNNPKRIANLKEEAQAYRGQEKALKELSIQYKNYEEAAKGANTITGHGKALSVPSKREILEQNKLLQEQEKLYRSSLDPNDIAYKNSAKRSLALEEEAKQLEAKKRGITKDTVATTANTGAESVNTDIKFANTAATNAEKQAKFEEAAASGTLTDALTRENFQAEANSMTKIQAIAGMFSLNKAKRLSAAVSLGLMSAEEAETVAANGATAAHTSLNAAIAACPIGWILAGVAAVAAALIIFAKAHETGAEKVERMDETMQKLSDSARETTSAIDELNDAWEKLQEQNDNLDKLTRGTIEWKKQLVEINQAVLDLIEKFPSLSAYVKMTDGKLEISEKGIEELQENQIKTAEIQQFASVATQLQQIIQKARNDNLYDESTKKFKVDNYKDSQDREEKAQKALTYDIDKQQKTQLLVSSALSGIKLSANVENDEKLKSIISGALELQDYDTRLEEIKSETSEDRQAYADLLGLTETQVSQMIKDGELTSDQLRTSLAAEKLLEEIRSTANNINNSLVGKGSNKHILNLIQNKLNSSDIKYFKEKLNGNTNEFVDFLKTELDKFGISPKENELLAYIERIGETSKELKQLNEKSFITETNDLTKIFNKALNNNEIDIASQKKLQEKFVQLSLSGIDKTNKQNFNKIIENILDDFGEDSQAKKFFVDKFLDLDISSLSDIENFFEELNNAGYEVSTQLQQEFKETTKAANDFSLENVQEALSSREAVNVVKEKVKSDKDSDESFTEEQYNKISSTLRNRGLSDLANNFVKDPTSSENSPKYFYKGSLSELGDKLESSIDNLTEEAVKKLEEQNKIVSNIERVAKESPDLIKSIEEGTYFEEVNTKAFGETGSASILINGIIKELIKDIDNGVGGFESDDTVKSFLNELLEYTFTSVEDYNETLTKLIKNYKLKPSDITLLMQNLIPRNVIAEDTDLSNSLGLQSEEEVENYFNELKKLVKDGKLPIDDLEELINEDSLNNEEYKVKLQKLLDENLITIEQYNEWLKLTPKEVIPRLKQIIAPSQSSIQIQTDIESLYGSVYNGKTAIEALKIFPKTQEALKAQNSVIQQIVESHEGWEIKLKKIKEQYNLTGEAATENARKIAAAQYELNEQVDNIKSILSDNEKILENVGTDKYFEAISKLTNAFKIIYGDEIDEEWVEENLGTIKQIKVGKIEAEDAFKELQATAKANPLKIQLKMEVGGDANEADMSFLSKKIQKFYDSWKNNSKTLGEEIAGSSDKIKTSINLMQEALDKINNSDIDMQVKINDRAAIGELIKVALLQAYIRNDIDAYRQWIDFASKNNFSTGGLQITRVKKKEAIITDTGIEYKEIGYAKNAAYLNKNGDITVTDLYNEIEAPFSSFGTDEEESENKTSKWKNDYDQYYNTLKKIEALERKRTELEKQQSRLVKQRFIDEEKLKANKKEQIKLLKQQAQINSDLANNAISYLRGSGNSDVWFDEVTGTIQTNPNAANYNEEQMEAFNDQKSLMENYYETWKNAKDNLENIYDAIDELTKVVEFSLEDLTDNINRTTEILDNTLTNLSREITRLDRYDSGATSNDYKKLFEQSAQTYADKYNQLTNKKAINEQELNNKINSDYSKYIDIDWNSKKVTKSSLYYAITDPETKESVDNFVKETQEIASNIIDMDNQQEEIRDSLYELQQDLADKSLEFQERVYNAVVKSREDEIANLTTINESIKEAASDLVSSIQKNIQKIRQDRTNKKTEEELSKLQSRLDFLQMDTSSGNQKTILDLQKQIEDKEQSYTDSLIDQKISELQEQNTEAEKQRKKQIEIMQAQLDLSKENGAIWKAVDDAIKTGFNSSGRIQKGSDLYNMLSSLDEVTKKNSVQFERWFGELNNLAAAYTANLTANLDTSGLMSDIVFDADGMYGENSEYIKTLKDRLEAMNRDGNFNDLMWYDQEGQKMVYKYSHYYASSDTERDDYNAKVAEYTALASALANARAFYKKNKNSAFTSAFKRMYGYDTGGLADYTGFAWLDGTKASPELVLNAKDTENFIQLKDILSNVMNGGVEKNTSTGDYYFEIKIDVDKITNDYDVDQMVERIKQQISNSARYRNVNVINSLR